ncbi:hypothetical protein V6R21_13825 [Limibacter armeniacum]|uniref:hypothetical protein n=1 Tax=Limibacter armeniacum TaxID=466084 RepID=UPI002FE53C63
MKDLVYITKRIKLEFDKNDIAISKVDIDEMTKELDDATRLIFRENATVNVEGGYIYISIPYEVAADLSRLKDFFKFGAK